MPAFHFHRRQLRRSAWATLVVWLFALTAGVVNTCVLTPAGPVGQVPHADIAVQDAQAGAPIVAGVGSRHDQGHGQDSGEVSCLKFCNDESAAIAKVKPPLVDLALTLLTVVEPWNTIAASSRVGVRQLLEQRGSQGPPLVIRFLRLTL